MAPTIEEHKKSEGKHGHEPTPPPVEPAQASAPAEAAAKKNRWTQPMIVTLSNAFNVGGVSAARNAFPDKTHEDVDAKLSSLGLTALSKAEQDELEKLLQGVMTHRDPRKALVFIRAATGAMISALNNPASHASAE